MPSPQSSGRTGDRENRRVRVQESKWGNLLAVWLLELPGQTAPWLPDLSVWRPFSRYPAPRCPAVSSPLFGKTFSKPRGPRSGRVTGSFQIRGGF